MHWCWRAVIATAAGLIGLSFSLGCWIGCWNAFDLEVVAESLYDFEPNIPPGVPSFIWCWLLGGGISLICHRAVIMVCSSSRLRAVRARKWVVLLGVSALAWLASILFDVRLFREVASFAVAKGCVGMYWSHWSFETNTHLGNRQLPPDEWPEFQWDGGSFKGITAGVTHVDGPPGTITADQLLEAWHSGVLNERMGLKWPVLHAIWMGTHCIVVPLWIPMLVSGLAVAFCAGRALRRPRGGCCPACGYNLTGNVSGVCPECGSPVPRGVISGQQSAVRGEGRV
ncbi:MAG: hypothetical protein AMXMBFR13_42070 [Phycisphaerae bacterium]